MNKFIRISILTAMCLLSAAAVKAQSGSITLTTPAAPSFEVNLTWQAPVAGNGLTGCDPTTNICKYNILRLDDASCPANLIGSSGWNVVGTTANSTLVFSDKTVAPLTQYSYVVEATLVSNGISSGPSNCVTATTSALPLVPAAPVQSPATTLSIP